MRITDALLGEHAVLYALFDLAESRLDAGIDAVELKHLGQALAAALGSHARVEEDIFFPALEARIGPHGPLAVMRAEHEEIDATVEAIARGDGDAQRLRSLIALARNHFNKEEHVLFPMAQQAIEAGTLEELAGRWATARKVALHT